MRQAVRSAAGPKLRQWFSARVLRWFGLVLLVVLLARLDLGQVYRVLRAANPFLVIVSIVAILPLIFVKTVRWQGVLRSQGVRFQTWPAFKAYLGSIFIGFLTPGRLGEFVKAVHVSRACQVSSARAFSSVLADRLFDLYALLLVGGAALLTLAVGKTGLLALAGSAVLVTLPLVLFLHDTSYGWFQQAGLGLGGLGYKLFAPESWLQEMRLGLRQLTWPWLLAAIGLTLLAYGLFFWQNYLLALALKLPAGFMPITYAVALGSLVTLLPISISGLGTREAAMITYLGTVGVSPEAALSFSLLVFLTFYLAGGLMGAVAWWLQPVDLVKQE